MENVILREVNVRDLVHQGAYGLSNSPAPLVQDDSITQLSPELRQKICYPGEGGTSG